MLVGHSSLVSAIQPSGTFWSAETAEGTNSRVSHVLSGSENWKADQPAQVRGSGLTAQGGEKGLDVNLLVCLAGNLDFLWSRYSNPWSLATFPSNHVFAQGHLAN